MAVVTTPEARPDSRRGTRPGGASEAGPGRLGPDDWTSAALGAIAEQGVGHVSIERLARELGTTKGSFYWHFKDRPALILAALERWERDDTDGIIERLSMITDPRQRFRTLLESAFEPRLGALIDANLLAAADDPAVASVLARVAAKRLAYIERIFRQAKTPAPADRALLAFTAYTGLTQLRRTSPVLPPTGRRMASYVHHVVDWLFADAAP